MRFFRSLMMIMTGALLGLTGSTLSAAPRQIDWTRVTTQSPVGGNILGNPAAPTKLVEYVSYTCPHCAHFVAEGTAPLKSNWVRSGRLNIEVRNLVRDRYDITAALLARCGGKVRFMGNHEAIFAFQNDWIAKIQAYEAAPDTLSDGATRDKVMQDIADKTGLSALMIKRGYTPAQLNTCLSDPKALETVLAMTKQAMDVDHVTGTPAFLINGKMANAHTWADLQPLLPAPRN